MPDLERVEALFQEAADLPEGERAAFLDDACAGDADLRGRVEALLERLAGPDSLVPPIVAEVGESEGPGTQIDRYKLLQRIGEGGFGEVYMAEQLQPVRRKVALKIIKLGMDTKEVVARFEAERQALAMMDHPNIAKVLDGGATDKGRPYFVMELVRGVAITDYCDQNKLGATERLELFEQVCHAVQHAHQKGVIHRDLKPTNVMVTLHDGKPVPKVIDFGVAKAIYTPLTEKTLFTEYQRFIGTPAYMSPEQAEMSGLDIDTRTDIYALGVLLYELLTGTTPFDTTQLFRSGLAEVQRVLREEPPQKPSLRISTTGSAAIAQARSNDVRSLMKVIRGDLDWVVMKALEKDRTRRYGTASDFAADVRRYLQGEPVEACPPSRVYRMRKFVARNRGLVSAAVIVVIALVGGLAALSIGLYKATQAQEREEEELLFSAAVTQFMMETLSLTDPAVAADSEMSVEDLLDRASVRVDEMLSERPAAEAQVRRVLGRAYFALDELMKAEKHFRRADELMAADPDADGIQHYHMLWNLTYVAFNLERRDAMEVATRTRTLGHDLVRREHAQLASALDKFILATNEQDPQRAKPHFERSNQLADANLVQGDPLWLILADTYSHAALSMGYTPRESHTVPYYDRVLEILRSELPGDSPKIGQILTHLVGVLNRLGRLDEAEGYIRESVQIMKRIYPDGSMMIAMAESMLGENLVLQGRYFEAAPNLMRSHEVIRTQYGPESFQAIDSAGRLVALFDGWGKPDQARIYREPLIEYAASGPWVIPWDLMRSCFEPEHDQLAAALAKLDSHRALPLSNAEIDKALRDAVRLRRELLADDSRLALITVRQLSVQIMHLPDEPDVRPALKLMLEDAARVMQRFADLHALEFAVIEAALSGIAYDESRHDESKRRINHAWDLVRDKQFGDDYILAESKLVVAEGLVREGMYSEAEQLAKPAYELLDAQLGPDNRLTRLAREQLDVLYERWKPVGTADSQ